MGTKGRINADVTTANEDAAWLARVADGDEQALRVLYDRHRAQLYRYLWHQMDGEAAAIDDALQEVFLAAWRTAAGFRGQATVATWLFQIAHHRVAALRAQHASHPTTPLDDAHLRTVTDHAPSLEQAVIARLDLGAALRRLSPKHREALELVALHGCSLEETAQILGVPLGTVKSRISNARRALAQDLFATTEEKPHR